MSESPTVFDLQQSYFELFRLPVAFDVEQDALDSRYLALQKAVHPDRFVTSGEQAQRLSVQYAAFVNKAYETLQSPLLRAVYLLKMADVSVNYDRHTVTDAPFLMQQMELRDELMSIRDSADPEVSIAQLLSEARGLLVALEKAFVAEWSERTNESLQKAAEVTHKMHFLVKFIVEAEQLEETLLDD